MQLPARHLIALSALLAFVPTPPTVWAAGIQPAWYHREAHPERGDGYVLPFLKRLRDSAIELILGPPPSSRAKPVWADAASVHARYRDDVVIRFNVTNPQEETALSVAAVQLILDVWAFTPDYVDVRISKRYLPGLLKLLPDSLQHTVLISDVAAAAWATFPSADAPLSDFDSMSTPAKRNMLASGADNIFFSDYQPLLVITNWMRLLQALFPSFTNITSIGKSYEGRDIWAFRVGEPNPDEKGPRKTILVTGGLHGREWISTSTVDYLLWSLVTSFGTDQMITKLLRRFDIVFVPVMNPDGYEYTWQEDRLWRKSRQRTKMQYCQGLDLDHAFGYEWESTQHISDPCSESYGGEEPFQSIEASDIADWAKNQTENGVKFIGFLDLHSYSQQILFPYAYSCSVDPPNRENLEELAVGLAKAIRLSSGESYTVASACEGALARSYSASDSYPRVESGGGSAIDWFYHELKARYSYQVKLRDTGSYGFLLPKEQIVPTGEEMLSALKYFGDYLLGNNGIESFPPEKAYEPLSETEWRDLRKRRR
ncbi:hypothetical protein B0T14DRAFT_421777 [Immersiella caudata]|uniref:Inactive metallocarboxypeptidase ECM14 n=1 Tax=Immersiella caudata TaxID=314043 RepID=A0AA40C5X9_9PEZI|nr:hypothetical protein B0T14DRAFT_421777 [Immersiella caudata]